MFCTVVQLAKSPTPTSRAVSLSAIWPLRQYPIEASIGCTRKGGVTLHAAGSTEVLTGWERLAGMASRRGVPTVRHIQQSWAHSGLD